MENVALWHERDISHSSVERIILPDSCTLLDYMLVKLRDLVSGLLVYPEHMQRNLDLTKGLYHSQTILLELTRRGMERKTAYEAVQRAAMKTWRGDQPLAENLRAEPAVAEVLNGEEIDRSVRSNPTSGTWTTLSGGSGCSDDLPARQLLCRERLTPGGVRPSFGLLFRTIRGE